MKKKQLTLNKKILSILVTLFILTFICYIFYVHNDISNNASDLSNNISRNDFSNNNISSNDNSAALMEDVDQYSEITITIDPGHGGFDPGKVGENGTQEKDVNLHISLYLKEELISMGFTVYMTRDTDTALYSENASSKKTSDLNNRINITNENKSDYLISIHQNSFSDEAVHGAQVFYYASSKQGKLLAECIQNSIKELVDNENMRDIKGNNEYLILKKSPCTSLIIECGFLSNYEECQKLCDSTYQQAMAHAIATGIGNYISSLYK